MKKNFMVYFSWIVPILIVLLGSCSPLPSEVSSVDNLNEKNAEKLIRNSRNFTGTYTSDVVSYTLSPIFFEIKEGSIFEANPIQKKRIEAFVKAGLATVEYAMVTKDFREIEVICFTLTSKGKALSENWFFSADIAPDETCPTGGSAWRVNLSSSEMIGVTELQMFSRDEAEATFHLRFSPNDVSKELQSFGLDDEVLGLHDIYGSNVREIRQGKTRFLFLDDGWQIDNDEWDIVELN